MKKEEARKLLDNTKVYVNGKSEEIQKKLFEIGYKWYNDTDILDPRKPFLYPHSDGYLAWGEDMNEFVVTKFKEVSADFILDINIDKPKYHFKPFDKVLVKYKNDVWTPQIYQCEDKEFYFFIGCQVISKGGDIIPYNEKTAYLVGTSKKYEEE